MRAALAYGFRVVATARDPKKLGDIVAGKEDKAKVLALDVTKPDQIKHAVSEAERTFGRMDVLVNNAGDGYLAAVEEGDKGYPRYLRDQLLRRGCHDPSGAAGNAGTQATEYIVNIASVGGVVGHAGWGYYAATKFAVEGLSESLAQEVEPLGSAS